MIPGKTLSASLSAEPVYIEDVFSTYLYAGNASTRSINNGIDLAGKGGIVLFKARNSATNWNLYSTTSASPWDWLSTLSTDPIQTGGSNRLQSFNSNGFTLGADYPNWSGYDFASWTFRKAEKFFDVVTYTGTSGIQTVNHNLGSVPGCIIMKATSTSGSWIVNHRSLPTGESLILDENSAASAGSALIQNATSTTFQAPSYVNQSGVTYVAYLFAHDAGGFGEDGSESVIKCGKLDGNGTVDLGWEPQWILWKRYNDVSNWILEDNMRGWPVDSNAALLNPNLSSAESAITAYIRPNATGFTQTGLGWNIIYIAIRRGPMKTPTTGTSVFNPIARTGSGTNPTNVSTSTNPDLLMSFPRTASPAAYGMCFWDKLRGVTQMLQSSNTNAETTTSATYTLKGWLNDGYQAGADFLDGYLNYSGSTYVNYPLTRAPGFFDEVCYTGNGTGSRALSHNLGVAPEMVIVKQRTSSGGNRSWWVLTTSGPKLNVMNDNSASDAFGVPANLFGDATYNNYIAPTSTTVTLSPSDEVNSSSNTYVMYLFATLAGVSKVGSYTGTGTTLQVNCGFTGGARFVLIKRTDSTGGWYVWDSARGIVAGNDPYLLLNSTAAEVTNTDYVDTYSAGFEISSTAPAAINANGGTYIFLAIA